MVCQRKSNFLENSALEVTKKQDIIMLQYKYLFCTLTSVNISPQLQSEILLWWVTSLCNVWTVSGVGKNPFMSAHFVWIEPKVTKIFKVEPGYIISICTVNMLSPIHDLNSPCKRKYLIALHSLISLRLHTLDSIWSEDRLQAFTTNRLLKLPALS